MPDSVLPQHRTKYEWYARQSFHYGTQAALADNPRVKAYYGKVKNRYDECLFFLRRRTDCTVSRED